MNKLKKLNIYRNYIFVSIFIILGIILSIMNNNETKNISFMNYNDFLHNVKNGNVVEVILKNNPKLKFKLNNNRVYKTDNPRNYSMKEMLLKNNIYVKESDNLFDDYEHKNIIILGVFGIIFFLIMKSIEKTNKISCSFTDMKELHKDSNSSILFKDIAGNIEAKESVQDIVDFIKLPEKYMRYGARMPKGIIFYGAPGTGKTLMAKAIAGEAKVPFYSVSGSDFVQMYVGVGAARIRNLFRKARKDGKAVIFIDEIDALGKKRNNSLVGGNDERDQTLNALLVEMSGFSSKEGIIVIAATNRIDILDEALLRPGRFDRQIEISLPDLKSRKQILKFYSQNKPICDSIDMDALAKQTIYFSGAMLENLLNEAAIYAAKNEKDKIYKEDIEKAYYTIVAGTEKKDRENIREIDKKITAFHEAGHALITKLILPKNIISRITIMPSIKGAGGFCVNIPEEKMYYTKKELEYQIMINLAGRIAEEIVFGKENITTGASNDIEKVGSIIKDYIGKYGMGKELKINENNNESIFEECNVLLKELYDKTKYLLYNNIRYLHKIAETLIENESIDEKELEYIMSL